MNRQEKSQEIERLAQILKDGPPTILVAPHGLKVNEISELRSKIRATSSSYRVVKNRLALRALKETPLENLAPHLRGETAIACSTGDPAALAKVIQEFARTNQGLKIKAGFVDGQVVGAAEVQQLAALPPRPVLIARLLGALNAPMTNLLRVLQGPARGLARVLDEIAKKQQQAGDSPASETPPES